MLVKNIIMPRLIYELENIEIPSDELKYNFNTEEKITINQNLMMYSRKAIDYVVLHEICHLKYMNHSKKFWDMVASYMPDYKDAEKELKQ